MSRNLKRGTGSVRWWYLLPVGVVVLAAAGSLLYRGVNRPAAVAPQPSGTTQTTTPPATSTPTPVPTPSFLVGWYDFATTVRIAQQASMGSNFALLNYSDDAIMRGFLGEALRYNIKVMMQPAPNWIKYGQLGQLRAWIRRYQHDPALWGWYLADEPDFGHIPPRRLLAAYRAIRAIDDHPVGVVFASGSCQFGRDGIDPAYAPAFDVLMFDDYQAFVPVSPVDAMKPLKGDFANCAASARRLHKRGFMLVLQAFGKGQISPGDNVSFRDPNLLETEYAYRAARASGAMGVLWYHDNYADAAVRAEVRKAMAQR